MAAQELRSLENPWYHPGGGVRARAMGAPCDDAADGSGSCWRVLWDWSGRFAGRHHAQVVRRRSCDDREDRDRSIACWAHRNCRSGRTCRCRGPVRGLGGLRTLQDAQREQGSAGQQGLCGAGHENCPEEDREHQGVEGSHSPRRHRDVRQVPQDHGTERRGKVRPEGQVRHSRSCRPRHGWTRNLRRLLLGRGQDAGLFAEEPE